MDFINFDRDKYAQLISAHETAQKEGKDIFIFEGHELLTQYAKYMIEFLKQKFEPPGK